MLAGEESFGEEPGDEGRDFFVREEPESEGESTLELENEGCGANCSGVV